MPFSGSCTMDSPNKSYKLFKEQHICNQLQCKTNKKVYSRPIKQENIVSYSHCINISGSKNSTTKIESSHFPRSYVENNVNDTYQIKQKYVITSSRQSQESTLFQVVPMPIMICLRGMQRWFPYVLLTNLVEL